MRTAGLIALGLALLVIQAAGATLLPMHAYAPNLMLPIVIFLGVSAGVHIVRGASICFVLGYLLDAFCGSPMGLQTFVLVASFFAARGAGLRLFPRGPALQIFLTFMMALVTGGTILALRAIFEAPEPFRTADVGQNTLMLLKSALVTALLSPLVFAAVRRIEDWGALRPEERAAAS